MPPNIRKKRIMEYVYIYLRVSDEADALVMQWQFDEFFLGTFRIEEGVV